MARLNARAAAASLVAACSSTAATAQNLGGVFPPMPLSKELEYRFGLRPGEAGASALFAHRIHYQETIADRLLLRGIAVASHAEGAGFGFDYVQAELFWETPTGVAPWRTGLRFDVRIAQGSAPEQVAVNWPNEFRLSETVHARFNILATRQIGDFAADGVLIETRSNIFKTMGNGVMVGVESFNAHGSTVDFDPYGGRQQIGPFATFPVGNQLTAFTGALFGVGAASPDLDVRLWLRRNF